MKAAFGLGGLLVTLGVIIFIMASKGGWLDQAKTAIDEKNKVEPQLQQLSGKDAEGNRADESATLEPQLNGGKMAGILVTALTPGGAYQTHFGFQQFDYITQIGPQPVTNMSESDAKAFLLDAYRLGQNVTILRGNQKLMLPQAPKPGNPSPTRQPAGGNALQRQLQGIQGVPTH